MTVRSGVASDGGFFEAMLFEAFFWDPGVTRPALLAMREERETRLGAAWFRLGTPHLHSYGFVDERTPELGIAVAPTHRGKGIGRALLRSLVARAPQTASAP